MFRWFLVEDVNGDIFEDELEWATTTEEAIKEATLKWEKMSRFDKKRRTAFYIMLTDTDEDGVSIQEHALEIVDLLKED